MPSLILKDQTEYKGISFGAERSVSGEVVFNTGMVGYVETITDPSYKGQILVLTYPLIGNYGVPKEVIKNKLSNFESNGIKVSGLIISDYSENYSHFSAIKSLSEWLKENDIPALYGIDTRSVTKRLREKGVVLGCIKFDKPTKLIDPNKLNLVKEVSTKIIETYGSGDIKIVLIDTGVKFNIIRSLLARNVTVIRIPWNFDPFGKFKFDAIFLPNGPGDPTTCKLTISIVKKAISKKIPIFGICLGNQILALAAGAKTYKLKFGHRGQNQPCIEVGTNRCFITSQNHGYAVNEKSLPNGWRPWFKNANDNTNEGIIHESGLYKSIQFHAEHCPGPKDVEFMFDNFIKFVRNRKK